MWFVRPFRRSTTLPVLPDHLYPIQQLAHALCWLIVYFIQHFFFLLYCCIRSRIALIVAISARRLHYQTPLTLISPSSVLVLPPSIVLDTGREYSQQPSGDELSVQTRYDKLCTTSQTCQIAAQSTQPSCPQSRQRSNHLSGSASIDLSRIITFYPKSLHSPCIAPLSTNTATRNTRRDHLRIEASFDGSPHRLLTVPIETRVLGAK